MNSSRLHVKSSRQTSTAKGKAEVPSRYPVSDRSLSNCSCSRTRAPDVLVVPFSQLDLFDGPFDLFGRTCGATRKKLLVVLSSRTFCHSPGWCVFRFLFCNLGAWYVKISRILLFFCRGRSGAWVSVVCQDHPSSIQFVLLLAPVGWSTCVRRVFLMPASRSHESPETTWLWLICVAYFVYFWKTDFSNTTNKGNAPQNEASGRSV